jgi:hypothetical protein
MRNLLALIGALVVLVGGLGWYLGWYKLNVTRTSDGNLRVETEVDTKKVTNDSGNALKEAGTLLDKANQEVKAAQPASTPGPLSTPQGGSTPTPPAPAPTPGWPQFLSGGK